ncbi:MAG TPA: hypothetical protein VJ875_01980 [Pyrinomonadaceae bacterium]|nr:hypothetical protein [Pyrinomonadaceae bacterium]
MNTQRGSFQLERTFPGAFLLQGIAGGALGAFIYTVMLCFYWGSNPDALTNVLIFTAICMFPFGAALGVIKATIVWGIYRLTGIQMSAFTRVMIATLEVVMLAMLCNQPLSFNFARIFNAGLCIAWLTVLPAALLIGSRVKPWELFTFGSIAVDGGRSGSKSVSATLATLPLRFLSLVGLWTWVLCFAVYWSWNERSVLGYVLFFLVPAIYLCLSLYLTFRSPSRKILFALGFLMNAPVAFIALKFYTSYLSKAGIYALSEGFLIVSIICCGFLLAWTLFVIARFTAPTVLPMTFTPRVNEPEHNCLGSRFLEWRQHAA